MRSHFRLNSSTALACAVSSATILAAGVCSGQIASDSASNPTYSGGWSAGQNGGFGFGAWSFDGTDPTPAGTYQGISTSSSLGTSWSLLAHSTSTGLANAGRSIIGGLTTGETFQTTIQNPVGYHFFRGFDILFTDSPGTNQPPGNNNASLRLSVFGYGNSNWNINDTSGHSTSLSALTTGASGMILKLTMSTATTYQLTLAPQSSPNSYYLDFFGTLAGPIDYVDFRNFNTPSSGLSDTADNFNIGSMTIVPEPSTWFLCGIGSISFMLWRRRRK